MLPGFSTHLVHTVRLLASVDLGVFLTGLGSCSPPAKELKEGDFSKRKEGKDRHDPG